MALEGDLIETESAADLMHPGLILGNHHELAILIDVSAAVTDTRYQQFLSTLKRRDESGAHAFERGVVRGRVHDAAIGLRKGLRKDIRVAAVVAPNKLGHGFSSELRGMFPSLCASHTIGYKVKAPVAEQEVIVLVVRSDAARIRFPERFEHEILDYNWFRRGRRLVVSKTPEIRREADDDFQGFSGCSAALSCHQALSS